MVLFPSSSVTVRVEKATSDLLIGPDWTLNMEICDLVNSGQWLAKDVIKAVKKRLQHKNPNVQFLALTLLETMVKNCSDYVHFQVVERGILEEMIKIVRKRLTDMQVRNKVLELLDSWQDAFGGPGGKFPQYYWACAELKRSGVLFPQRSPYTAPIFAPPRTHAKPTNRHPQAGYGMPPSSSLRLDEAMASEMANLSVSDFDHIRNAMDLLNEMLRAVNPDDHGVVKDEVIADLESQCRSNQRKLMNFLSSTRDEVLLRQGLELNDNLQSALAKHDAIASGTPLPPEAPDSFLRAETPCAPTPPVVINQFEDEEDEDDDDDDDEFAQLARRNSKFKPSSTGSTSYMSRERSSSQNCKNYNESSSSISSTIGENALVLLDSPVPVKTASKEKDMIDLLSITLSSEPSTRTTPLTPSSSSNQRESPASISPNKQAQSYVPYNSYVASWARSQPQPQYLDCPPQPQLQFGCTPHGG
uniref:TOM1-like protein 2 n=1 Tax=Ananas comosus var. bracteatus TaxID=296719 RepID=A0A6V7QFF2_ANACO|nr:unnamed protein product [Ananas comosus var. bracteatus]